MRNLKKRGTEFERRVRKKLESEGYLVLRSAGSFGAFDLIAIEPANRVKSKLLLAGFSEEDADKIMDILRTSIIGIQCKVNGRLDKIERTEILELAEKYNIEPRLYWREGRKLNFEVLE